jgi:hypothetical protein
LRPIDLRKLLRNLLGQLAVRVLRGKRAPKPDRARTLVLVAEPLECIERQPSRKPERVVAVLTPWIEADDRLVVGDDRSNRLQRGKRAAGIVQRGPNRAFFGACVGVLRLHGRKSLTRRSKRQQRQRGEQERGGDFHRS